MSVISNVVRNLYLMKQISLHSRRNNNKTETIKLIKYESNINSNTTTDCCGW